MRKPRRFNLPPIYVDTRKEQLAEIERRARKELGGEGYVNCDDDNCNPIIHFPKPRRYSYMASWSHHFLALVLLAAFIWIIFRLIL